VLAENQSHFQCSSRHFDHEGVSHLDDFRQVFSPPGLSRVAPMHALEKEDLAPDSPGIDFVGHR
jgi:hypothetical protein